MARGRKKAENPAETNLTQSTFVEYYREYSEARQKVDDANSALRSVLKRAKTVGINTAMLTKAREEQRMDRDKLESNIKDLERYRAWLGLPTGTQSEMFPDAAEAKGDSKTASEQAVWDAGERGLAAGKAGHARDSNPFTAGSEEWQAFDRAYVQGKETFDEEQTRLAEGLTPPKRGKRNGAAAEGATAH